MSENDPTMDLKPYPWTPINQRLTDLPVSDLEDYYVQSDLVDGPQYCAYAVWEPLEHIIHAPNSYASTLVPEYWEYMQKADWSALKTAWQRHIWRFTNQQVFYSDLEDDDINSTIVNHTEYWGEPEEPEEYDPERHLDYAKNNADYHFVKRQIKHILEDRLGISFNLPDNLPTPEELAT